MKITTIGIDLAKGVFQIHGVDMHGKAVLRKRLRRSDMVRFYLTIHGRPRYAKHSFSDFEKVQDCSHTSGLYAKRCLGP